MKTLNLDINFNPFGKEEKVEFESFLFSGGEPHIKIKSQLIDNDEVMITHRLTSFNDLGLFMITVDAVRRMGVKTIKACIPYFPAARQDRLMIPGEPLSVKVYADILNTLKLDEVIIFDPHSEVTSALLNNNRSVTNHKFIAEVVSYLPKDLILISPDGGALKKIYKVAAYLQNYEVVECSKSRDVKTGKLKDFRVYTDTLNNRPCLIVDDICDGGGTFMGLAEMLKQKEAGDLYIAVSHGIFKRGVNDLLKHFKQIYTTNSFKTIENIEGVHQINLNQDLLS